MYTYTSIIACNFYKCSRNNGYAISTPVSDQYAGDGIGKCIAKYYFLRYYLVMALIKLTGH